jgi:ataxin-3
MEYIFHETQDGLLCAQHCLNSLLQGDYYSAVDLANIAHELDRLEHNYLNENGAGAANNQLESSNYDDTGYFSIQVLQHALKSWNLDLIPYKSSNELAKLAREHPQHQHAYICNFKHHWYTIRKIGKYWFNLNSMFKKPELISDTYLTVLLKQLETDHYSIFIVDGQLPRSEADIKLELVELDVKDILNRQVLKRQASDTATSNNHGFDDDELKKAIKMSLIENDLDLDSHKAYSSLAHENPLNGQLDFDDDLKKAIRMSLMSENHANKSDAQSKVPLVADAQNSSIDVKTNTTPTTTATTNVESVDEIRKKRLEYLEKNKNNDNK